MVPLRLLAALLSVLLLTAAACSGGGAAPPSPAPTATPPTTPTAEPTPTPNPTPTATPVPPPALDLSAGFPRQGGLLVARLLNPPPGAQDLAAAFADGTYPMAPDGDGMLAVIGLATDFPPGDYTVEALADGDSVASAPVSVAAGEFERLTLTVSDETFGLLTDAAAIEEERQLVEEAYSTYTPERLWSGAWLRPVEGPISNAFGVQRSVNGGPYTAHGGADIVAEGGTPIVAAASGRVVLAQPLYLLGNSVIIDHGAGLLTGYHHMSSIAVEAGQQITKGDLVGFVGTTGFSSGDHLHWEARIHGVKVDALLLVGETLE